MAKKISPRPAAKKKPVTTKRTNGRPSKYKQEYDAQAAKLAVLGMTDTEMADFFEVAESTFHLWKKNHLSFSESIKSGKVVADSNVAASLYQKAVGFQHKEDKIFLHDGKPVIVPTMKKYAPDATAAIFWLKNRQPEKWRDTKVLQGDKEKPLLPPITGMLIVSDDTEPDADKV